MVKKSGFMGLPLTFVGGVIGFVAINIAMICILGAVLLYTCSPLKPYPINLFGYRTWIPGPNVGYSWTTQWISDLGVGPSSYMFNVGLMVTGVLCIPFFPTLLEPLEYTRRAKLGVAVGLIAGVTLIGIGAFPENTGVWHGLFSVIFWSLIAITAGILSSAMSQSTFFSKRLQWLGYFELAAGLVCLILSGVFGSVPEWTMLFTLAVWVYALSIEMLVKGKTL
ncbi:MAG: DUF998 domain-containing protein [Candidatus Freyarchaeota archaeon]